MLQRVKNLKTNRILILISLMITACTVSNPKYFSGLKKSNDHTYAYSSVNPVCIKKGDIYQSVDASYYFLSRLRTTRGEKLKLIKRVSVQNPVYKKPAFTFKNGFTGETLNYGKGPKLDVYYMLAPDRTDTIRIFINPYIKGKLMVPAGLSFEYE